MLVVEGRLLRMTPYCDRTWDVAALRIGEGARRDRDAGDGDANPDERDRSAADRAIRASFGCVRRMPVNHAASRRRASPSRTTVSQLPDGRDASKWRAVQVGANVVLLDDLSGLSMRCVGGIASVRRGPWPILSGGQDGSASGRKL